MKNLPTTIEHSNAISVHGEKGMRLYPKHKAELSLFNENAFNAKLLPKSILPLLAEEIKIALNPIDSRKVMPSVKRFLGQFAKMDVANVNEFTGSLTALFADYPEHAIKRLTLELPRLSPYPPKQYDIHKFLESIVGRLRIDLEILRMQHERHVEREKGIQAAEKLRREREARKNEPESLLERLRRRAAEEDAAKADKEEGQ